MIKLGKLLIFFLSLVIVASLLFVADFLYRPMCFSKKTDMILVIDKNTTAKSLVTTLKSKRLIKHDKLLLAYIKFFGISKKLKAGIFEIHKQETVTQLLKRVVDFDVLRKTLQITAGNSNLQLANKLREAEYLNYTKSSWSNSLLKKNNLLEICSDKVFYHQLPENIRFLPKPSAESKSRIDSACKNAVCAQVHEDSSIASTKQISSVVGIENRSIMTLNSKSPSHNTCINNLKKLDVFSNFEGLYLADTYQYNAGSDAETLLLSAHINLKKCLFNAWEQRNLSLPYTSPYELLIVASILEKESALNEDKRLISGVIVNRLRKNMPLQMDPTVIYGLQDKYKGKLSHDDLQIESEYNTYRKRGLPPTPIAIVSCESINAASQPNLTDYLYFVAKKNSGKHIFSKTYLEHRKAIKNSV